MPGKRSEYKYKNMFMRFWSKNIFSVETKKDFRQIMRAGFFVFLAGLILLGGVRIAAIGVFGRNKYRSTAELDAYTEKTLTAKRGAIYDSHMNTLSMSYGVYDFIVDPWSLREKLVSDIKVGTYYKLKNNSKVSKDPEIRRQTQEEILTGYYKYMAKAISDILNEGVSKKSDKYISAVRVFNALNSLYQKNKDGSYKLRENSDRKIQNRYQVIAEKINVEKKQKIDALLNDCYYNYYFDKLVVSKDKVAYYYDYMTGETTLASKVDGITARSLRKKVDSCICREGTAFVLNEIVKRSYPEDGYCSSFLGFVSGDSAVGGLEMYYDSVLSGKDGRISGLAVTGSGKMKSISNAVENSVQEGGNLVLTIDPQIQKILEDNLKSTYYKYSADETYGIVMNCKSGAIYAMSNYPNFDLNNPTELTDRERALEKAATEIRLDNRARNIRDDEGNIKEPTEQETEEKALNNQWMNFCVSYPYELGSTFKIFTASAGIEEGVIDPNTETPFYYCGGSYKINDERTIPCSHGTSHGSLDLGTAIAKSCNGFFIHLGLTLGADVFNKYFRAFGFTEKTGIDLSSEVVGSNRATPKMTRTELGSTAYGQTATITPIQLITAASAIANGGELVKPYIVDKIIDSDGNLVSKTETTVRRQVISKETSDVMIQKMKKVIYEPYGTAHRYFTLEGYEAAGKTGSGEIQGQGRSEGKNDFKYTASFVGFAPAEDPQVIILFGIRNPKGGYLSGGEIAAPPASTIMQYAMSELNVPKSAASEEGKAPKVEGLPLLTAKTLISNEGCTFKEFGGGDTVVRQIPQAGDTMPDSGLIALFTDEESYDKTAKVPNFIGLTKREVIEKAKKKGINVVCENCSSEGDKAVYQNYKEKAEVYPGQTITVRFSAG